MRSFDGYNRKRLTDQKGKEDKHEPIESSRSPGSPPLTTHENRRCCRCRYRTLRGRPVEEMHRGVHHIKGSTTLLDALEKGQTRHHTVAIIWTLSSVNGFPAFSEDKNSIMESRRSHTSNSVS